MIFIKKKIFIYILFSLLIFLVASTVLFDFNNNKKHIKIAEVAHTVFYAPQYVAIEKNFFSDFGLDVEFILTPGADKVTSAVLSNDVQIGFCGSEASIYIYNGNQTDYMQSFAQLTQKDGTFIVSRKKIKNFNISRLKDKVIIGGRAYGMPEMTLEYALNKNGINSKKDLNIDTSIAFSSMSAAFIGGTGDFVTLFEPNASDLENKGYGHIVASVGELAGNVPYTSYLAKKSFIKNNKDIIKKFRKAIQKGLDYVNSNSSKTIAKTISKQFPNTSLKDLETAIERYKKINVWPKSIYLTKESFDHLQDIMIDYGALNNKVDYNKLVYIEE